jgi:hypothetical protein
MEIWKDIPDYEGIYQASSQGRIRTVEGKITYSVRHGERHWKSRILKGRGDNYRTGKRVNLWKDKKSKDFLVARLVALTFLGEPPEGFTVNHKDGNRLNNSIDNLEWLSLGDNIRHGFDNLLFSQQKPIRLIKDGKSFDFRSMAQCDKFLNRHRGYTSETTLKKREIRDSKGNVYTSTLF